MDKPIRFDEVADIYDYYVNVDMDIPFFKKETESYSEEILELMCGTGRVSIPLLKAGRKMTCVDYSKEMLEVFKQKIKNNKFSAKLLYIDVTKLELRKKYGMIIMPFHSLSEILSKEDQMEVLRRISMHLKKGGIFILTLQNPVRKVKSADGNTKSLGKFQLENGKNMEIVYNNRYNPFSGIVYGFQYYTIYNSKGEEIEKRFLDINYRLISDYEVKELIAPLGLIIEGVYGDYHHGEFNPKKSDYMIYKLRKK